MPPAQKNFAVALARRLTPLLGRTRSAADEFARELIPLVRER
jgi:hypothetical protein